MSVRPSEDGRYTLAEARIILAREFCRRHGHSWDELKNGMGDLISMHCTNCGLTLVPKEGIG